MECDNNIFNNAIKSMYQLIMLVDSERRKCSILDLGDEIRNISERIKNYDVFCDRLCENIHPQDREDYNAFMSADNFPDKLAKEVSVSMECRIRQTNRRYYWAEIIFLHYGQEDSQEGKMYLLLIRNINSRKKKDIAEERDLKRKIELLENSYEELFEDNMKDEQTGCYNRKGLNYYVEKALKEASKKELDFFVCMADLNGLKHLNDTYGHIAGDKAIAVISSILIKYAPKGSRIVRVGGDEFLLFAPIKKDSKEPEQMEKNVDKAVAEYNVSNNEEYEVGVSYGWVIEPAGGDRTDIDDLIEEADEKMYEMRRVRDKYRRDP